jgi:ornithine decarboxylase
MVYTINLAKVRQSYDLWNCMFPTITPYYAVKCCPDPEIIRTLSECGAGFDCASPAELKLVPEYSKVIYANPCKNPDDIVQARKLGVFYTTFDSISELHKLAKTAPDMILILRIKADDPMARCPMGNKFGATEPEWEILAKEAKRLGLFIRGVSFHVGSFAQSPDAHAHAISKAYDTFQILKKYDHAPYMLDIGGGFSSESLESVHPACATINEAIIKYGFKNVIAEPGRFFVEHAVDLHTKVIGTKENSITIDDSLYGAFNCILMDHAKPTPLVTVPGVIKTVFGCTCDGADIIGDMLIPDDTQVGDILTWTRMGAYTLAASTNFNGLGFDSRRRIYLR